LFAERICTRCLWHRHSLSFTKIHDVNATSSDNYRGITVSGVISKLFEICLYEIFNENFQSSDLQFGFKKGMGCRNAILTARLSASYFIERGSTVVVSALDISKAFDKVDHFCLFLKLINRGVPRIFIEILINWFSKCIVRVKWGGSLSDHFRVLAGVRQGGVLSPFLFAMYIDCVISRLQSSGYGFHINGVFFGCIAYADDILLMANSLSHMQRMLNICTCTLRELDLCFYIDKSAVMRMGPRFLKPCSPLTLNGKNLKFVDVIKYLGTYIKQGRVWRNDITQCRASFYRAFNAILSKTKLAVSEITSVHLMNSICLPILTYAQEACYLTKTQLKELDAVIDNSIRKIFNVQSAECVSVIRAMFDIPSISYLDCVAKCKFLCMLSRNNAPIGRYTFKLAFNECLDFRTEMGIDLSLSAIAQCQCLLNQCMQS